MAKRNRKNKGNNIKFNTKKINILENNLNIKKIEPTKIKKGSSEDIENESGWSTKLIIHKNCPYSVPLVVEITQEQLIFLDLMDKEFPDLEFGVYLHGKYINNNTFRIEKLDIPKQIVTYAHIDYKETHPANGMLHKHPTGCHEPSSDDINFGNANHDISLIYSDGKIVWSQARFKTKCGCMIEREVIIRTIINVNIEKLKLEVERVKNNIEKKTFIQQTHTHTKQHHFGSKWDDPNEYTHQDISENAFDNEQSTIYKDADIETDQALIDYQNLLADKDPNDIKQELNAAFKSKDDSDLKQIHTSKEFNYDLSYTEYMERDIRGWD